MTQKHKTLIINNKQLPDVSIFKKHMRNCAYIVIIWGLFGVGYGQTPVKISNPYIFNKYVKMNDSLMLKIAKFNNYAVLPTPDKPALASRNDTLFFWNGSEWKAIGSGGTSTVGNGISISGDSIQLGGSLTKDTYVGGLGEYDYIIYNTAKDYSIDVNNGGAGGVYQFHDSSLNVNAKLGIEYAEDIQDTIEDNPLSIPFTGMVRNMISDSLQSEFDTLNFSGRVIPQFPDSGTVWFQDGTLKVKSDIHDVTMDVGEEVWSRKVRNNTGSIIANGTVVRISGNVGNKMTIAKASYSTADSSGTLLGVTTHDIGINEDGRVTLIGKVGDLNTSAYSAGDTLYLSYSGLLRKTKPSTGYPIRVGFVEYAHGSNGRIIVSIERQHDLRTSTATNLTGLIYGNGSSINASSFNTYDSTTHVQTIIKNAIGGTTASGGVMLRNNTVTTVGSPLQLSPMYSLYHGAWDTDGSNDTYQWNMYAFPASAATTSSTFRIYSSKNGAAEAAGMQLSNTGAAVFASNVSVSNGNFSTNNGALTSNRNNTGSNPAAKVTSISLNANTAATGTVKIQTSPYILQSNTLWNGSASQFHYWTIGSTGIADTEKSLWQVDYGYGGTTSYKTMLEIEGNRTVSTANKVTIGEGTSQASPNLAVVSTGKSTAIGADASKSFIVADNSGSIVLGFDSKANIDARNGTPAAGSQLILNNNGRLYRNTVATDSAYLISGDLLRTAGDAVVGAVKYNSTTKTAGQFYGGTSAPSSTTRLNYDGNLYLNNLTSKGGIVSDGTTATHNIYYTNSGSGNIGAIGILTSNGYGFGTQNSSTGTSFYALNDASGTGKAFSYFKQSAELASIDNTGKGTFAGGLVSGTTTNGTNIASTGFQTLTGTAKAWNDIVIGGFNLGTATAAPVFTTGWAGSSAIGANYFQGSVQNDIAYFNIQIPHNASPSDSLRVHIHGGPTTTPAATDSVVFKFTYSYAEIGATFPAVATQRTVIALNGLAQWSHNLHNIYLSTTGTGTAISGIYNCSIERLQNDASDTYTSNWGLLSIDAHAKINGFGSRYYNAK